MHGQVRIRGQVRIHGQMDNPLTPVSNTAIEIHIRMRCTACHYSVCK